MSKKFYLKIFNFFFRRCEFQKISRSRQKLARQLNAHEIILYFIRRKMWSLPKILVGDYKFPFGYKKAFVTILNDCYNFLILFCKYNPDNQDILYACMDQFLIQMNYDVGQIDLLCTVTPFK